jgi:hypothetical protein
LCVALLTIVELLNAANGDSGTALAILQHADTTRLLFGVALSGGPLIALFVVSALYMADSLPSAVAGVGLIFGLVTLPVIAWILVLGFVFWKWLATSRKGSDQPASSGTPALLVGIAIGILMTLNMWLPREVVTVRLAGQQREITAVGYVLNISDTAIVMLDADEREVDVYKGEWANRQICGSTERGGWWTRPAFVLLGDENPAPVYPRCPEEG